MTVSACYEQATSAHGRYETWAHACGRPGRFYAGSDPNNLNGFGRVQSCDEPWCTGGGWEPLLRKTTP